MNRTLTTSALLSGLLLTACASAPQTPAALLEARSIVRSAELDSAVLANAPLEMKKATDSLDRANRLQDKGESLADVSSAAYIAQQQARTAMAVAKAKGNDASIAGAEVDRERARADMRSAEAEQAKAQANTAQAQATVAQAQASSAQARATSAQAQAGAARQQAAASDQRASSAELMTAQARADTADAQVQSGLLQQRLLELQATQTERGMLVTLGDVLFESNRSEVKPGAQSSLRKLAEFLQQYPTRSVLIEGHTDNIGTASTNAALSLRRADAVDAVLIGMGVSGQRVVTIGYGEQYPVADNATDTNRALNRRVEVYIAENNQPVRARR